jgi:asparagine synthase (glutamine-hydrolysing)
VEDYLFNANHWRFHVNLIKEKNIQETAKENRTNLIFSGWGGDEFISMRNRGIDADLIREFDWALFF